MSPVIPQHIPAMRPFERESSIMRPPVSLSTRQEMQIELLAHEIARYRTDIAGLLVECGIRKLSAESGGE